MARSIGLLGVIVLVVLLVGPGRQLIFPSAKTARAVRTVGYSDVVTALRRAVPYDVPAPVSLPAGWRSTSARITSGGQGLHIGFVTPSGAYAAVEESGGPQGSFLATVLGRGSRVQPAVDVGGRQWRQLRTSRAERALVRTVGQLTVVVTGSAGAAELDTLAGSLRPA